MIIHSLVRNLIVSAGALLASVSYLDATVLSTNLDQPISYTEIIDPSTQIASSFGTGNIASTLLDVQMVVSLDGQTNPSVLLYSDQSGQPGSEVGSLALSQAPSGTGPGVALFSGQSLPLAADSTYWIVAASSSGSWEWAYTESSMGSGAGFQHTWGVSLNKGGDWYVSNVQPMMMSVADSAMPTPEPASVLLMLVAAIFMLTCWKVSSVATASRKG